MRYRPRVQLDLQGNFEAKFGTLKVSKIFVLLFLKYKTI